ncbi:solute carrier family 2, facilitated glucose transporter member 8-like isoform X2 [Cimex lectularius]|uniref:Major facilitator superfamily (MFS) profile domain-containing protein n=1 Tax=Cimex lectularius TaxID=79782 RepID=A0A8I6S0V2_CIMLE|nr:solute carrier family 2, facilitated glucose transporter member 8-like isoform X2 [Cimex lectularius]
MNLSTPTQVGLSLIALGNLVANGMSVSYPSVAIPAIKLAKGRLEPNEASWIGSIPQLSMIVGCFVVGPIVDRYGRRMAFIMSAIPGLLGWVTIALGADLVWVYIGRLLTGVSMGFSTVTTSVFLAEITSPALRGPITMGKAIAFSTGLTFMYVIGWIFQGDWRIVAIVAALVPSLTLIMILKYLPESKIWEEQSPCSNISYKKFFTEYRKRPEVYIPFNIMNILLILRQLSGTSVILAYANDFLIKTGVHSGKANQVSVAIGFTRIIFGLVAAWLSKRFGRRKPVTFSGTIMALTILGLSLYLRRSQDLSQPILIVGFVVFVGSSTIFTGIMQSIVGEVFPSDVRGMCSGLTSCTTYTTAFVALQSFPWLSSGLDGGQLLMVFATFCVVSAIATIALLPETNGKTLEEIRQIFAKNVEPVETNLPLNPSMRAETTS